MFVRILKKDLKRKKTMNTILLLFIILATMFVASGLNNVITVMNGTDYYLDQAGIGDYIIITMGDDVVGGMEEVLSREPKVQDYKIENVVFASQSNVSDRNGKELKTKNSLIFQSLHDSKLLFFDCSNEKISTVKKGHAYVSGSFMESNHLNVGDVIEVAHGSVTMSLILDGKAKDALLGSDFMGNTRILLNDQDMQRLLSDEEVALHYQGEIAYIETDDVKSMSSAITDISNVAFDGTRDTIKMCYIMDMIVAFITLILSICLIIVSFVVLKFSIHFTIAEEFREIGVMKAVGITNRKIRSLYIGKYLMLALIGAIAGFFASIPFGNMLLKSVSENMVLGNSMGILANFFGALLVVFAIFLFAYHCTGKVKKSSPVDAIRSGQTGERYKKKTIYRIGNSHIGATSYLAVNDVISSPRRFITIMIPFCICTLFVLILVNTTATMKSDNLIDTFGTKSDLYVTDVGDVMSYMNTGSKSEFKEYLEQKGEELTKQGMPASFCVEIQYKYTVSFEGEDYVLSCQQGMGTKAADYKYKEGLIPQNKNEIAITPQISEMTGAKIGDTVTIDFGNEKQDCVVTAYFESMNQLGEIIRFHEDAPTDLQYVSSIMQYQINFTDDPSEEEIEERKDRIKKLYDNDEVMNATEYCMDCVGVVDTMEAVQYLLLAITLIVVLLVTILMERSFIADENSQIAILKAIGFKDFAIIRWHTFRFGLVSLLSVVLAAILSVPMTKLCISPIFGMMGARDIVYNIDPLQVFMIYPGIIFGVTVLIAWFTALYTKTIKSSDTANIE